MTCGIISKDFSNWYVKIIFYYYSLLHLSNSFMFISKKEIWNLSKSVFTNFGAIF
jgi:hypothetical protein